MIQGFLGHKTHAQTSEEDVRKDGQRSFPSVLAWMLWKVVLGWRHRVSLPSGRCNAIPFFLRGHFEISVFHISKVDCNVIKPCHCIICKHIQMQRISSACTLSPTRKYTKFVLSDGTYPEQSL